MAALDDLLDDPIARRMRQIALLSGQQVQPQGIPQQPQPAQLPPLSPQEENELLSQLGADRGSALSWLGNTLDYLGRPVRGLLGGHPEELASLIPFSDTLGITDKMNEVSGRGLLENWGLLDKQPEGAGFFDDPVGNVAGIGAAILTDPLSWMGFGLAKHGAGALSEGGQVARALGALPDWKTGMQLSEATGPGLAEQAANAARRFVGAATPDAESATSQIGQLAAGKSGPTATAMQQTLRDVAQAKGIPDDILQSTAAAQGRNLDQIMDQPLAGLVGVGPPIFGAENWATFGHGPLAQGIANLGTKARLGARYSIPGRFAAGLFDVPSKQMGTTAGQIAAREATEATEAANTAQQFNAAGRLKEWQDLGMTPREGLTPENAMGAVYEKSYPLDDEEAAVAELARKSPGQFTADDPTLAANRTYERAIAHNFPGATPEQVAGALDIVKRFEGEMGSNLGQMNESGIQRELKDKTVPYVGRQAAPPPGAKQGMLFANEALQTTGVPGRLPEFQNMPATAAAPGGTASLNQMAGDARIVGPTANLEGVPLESVLSNPKGEMIDARRLAGLPKDVQQAALDAFNASDFHGMANVIRQAKAAGQIAPDVIDALNAAKANVPLTRTTPEAAQNVIWQDYKGYSKPELDARMLDVEKYKGLPDSQIQKQMAQEFGEDADNAFERFDAFRTSQKQVENLQQRAFQNRLPVFPNDPETDSLRLQMKNVENANAGKAVARHIGRVAAPVIGAEGDRGVPILQNLKDSGLEGAEPLKTVAEEMAKRGLVSPEYAELLQHGPLEVPEAPMVKKGAVLRTGGAPQEITAENAELARQDVNAALEGHNAAKEHNAAYNAAVDRLNNFRVPFKNAADNNRVMAFLKKGPDVLGTGEGWWKSATQLFKAWNVAPWPANKIRDFVTGLWQQFAGGWHYGTNPASPTNWTAPLAHMNAILRGQDVDLGKYIPIFKGLSPAEATAKARQMMFATGLDKGLETSALNPNGPTQQAFRSISQQLPGAEPFKGVFNTLKSMIPTSMAEANPLNIRGVGGRTEDINSLIKGGRELSDQAWTVPKGAIFLSALSKGHPMEQAAAIAKSAMVDFDRLTPFERKLLRSMLPFATWMRHMVPWLLSEVAHNPGGTTAQAIRAVGGAAQKGFVPKQLEGDTSIALTGEDESGNKKYLSGFDLPFEALNDLFHPGPNVQETIKNTLAGWAGFTNPLIKVPVELATNRQLYSGRELTDLKGRLGYLGQEILGTDKPLPVPMLAEELVMNSPAGRLLSTGGKLLDPRKGVIEKALNTLTGFHTTDVDMPQARDAAARDAAATLLQGNPNVRKYTDLYVKPQDIGNLSESEQKLMAIYRDIGKQHAAEAKARKKQAELTGATP